MTNPSVSSPKDYTKPCQKVRTTCRQWMEKEANCKDGGKRSVAIHLDKLGGLAEQILQKKKDNPSWIEWDEENWHYQGKAFVGSKTQREERVALYILTLDAINFCFWPHENCPEEAEINSFEYDHLAIGLKKLAEADDQNAGSDMDSYAFSPSRLAAMTEESMKSLLTPHLAGHSLPNMKKRALLVKEVGEVLTEHFDGSATSLLERADNSGPKLVELIFTFFPGFRDEVCFGGNRVVFLKRAQIFVGDVNAALKLNLQDMDQLTTFADYRVPQILRHFDILEYSQELEKTVDSGQEIPRESADEISIRAATVIAVEELVRYLNSDESLAVSGRPFTDVNVDWYLWQVSEKMHQDKLLSPFHKVRTHFY